MVKTPRLSRGERQALARKRAGDEKERRLKLIRELAKKRELLRAAKAEESNDGCEPLPAGSLSVETVRQGKG
jgi:hypothetical protein